MAGFWDRILGRTRTAGSAETAKERLQFVLLHDRISLPPERLKMMKEEIIAVISKYVAVTGSDVDIALKQRDRHSNMLIAEIPFLKGIQPPRQDTVDDEIPLLTHEQDGDVNLSEVHDTRADSLNSELPPEATSSNKDQDLDRASEDGMSD